MKELPALLLLCCIFTIALGQSSCVYSGNVTVPTACNNSTECQQFITCTHCIRGACSIAPPCGRPCTTTEDCVNSGAADAGCSICSLCDSDDGACVTSPTPGVCVPAIPEKETTPIWSIVLQWLAIAALLSMSGLFSGLNLGLMGLDIFALKIYTSSGTKQQKIWAKRIFPLRKHGNLLLCTILLGNVAVNTLLSILLASFTSGLLGFILSTGMIVVFGEIVPQSVCSRHALRVGAYTTWLVWIFLVVMLPVSWPISKILDIILGDELGTIYKRAELKKFLEFHMEEHHGDLTKAETTILAGALDLSQKSAEEIMTPIDDVFMLNLNQKLTYKILNQIMEKGYSRIPVYEGTKDKIVGLLLVKDLALLNPDDEAPLKTVFSFYGRQFLRAFTDDSLEKLLNDFKKGVSHFAVVRRVNNEGEGDPFYETVGIVTLEDIIEEILQDEIVDETDVYIDNRSRVLVKNKGAVDYKKLTAFAGQKGQGAILDAKQAQAIHSFLPASVKLFAKKKIGSEVLEKLISQAVILDIEEDAGIELYTRGKKNKTFTLILQGKVEIRAGAEEFVSHAGPFSYLGLDALTQESFIPDFTATVVKDSRVLKITKRLYDASIKATKLAKISKASRSRLNEDKELDDKESSSSTFEMVEKVDLEEETNKPKRKTGKKKSRTKKTKKAKEDKGMKETIMLQSINRDDKDDDDDDDSDYDNEEAGDGAELSEDEKSVTIDVEQLRDS